MYGSKGEVSWEKSWGFRQYIVFLSQQQDVVRAFLAEVTRPHSISSSPCYAGRGHGGLARG